MSGGVRQAAERAAFARLATLQPAAFRATPCNYTTQPATNLVTTVEEQDFLDDLNAGSGSELIDGDSTPAKFCAAHSSSALAVNSFGPFRRRPRYLVAAGIRGFREFRFEKQLPTGLKGTPPNLDAVAVGVAGTVCIESKFLEPLSDKEAKFSSAYGSALERLADDAWARVYRALVDEPRLYARLDAAQLVKHYLGMRHSLAQTAEFLVLLYVYWEPVDAAAIPEYRQHRREVQDFSRRVAGGSVRFAAQSYAELWDEWERSVTWERVREHVGLLRERYLFELGG